MKKPKIKKRKNYYLVYTDKKSALKCYSLAAARLWYNVLAMQ